MSDAPAISVVMPVYNAATLLREAVESILNQTFGDFELIAVDDGSTDHSPAILHDYARRDGRLQVISRPNTGIVGALNDGLGAARGAIVARMDGDDVALPARFEQQMQHMRRHPDCVLLGTMTRAIDPHGLPLFEQEPIFDHTSLDAELMKGRGGVIRHPTVFMRRSAVEQVGGYRPGFQWAEDLDLFLRLAEVGTIGNLPEMLLLYRQHPGSVNRTRFAAQADVITRVVRDAAQRRGISLAADWRYQPQTPLAPQAQVREWGWRALKAQRVSIARRHAFDALRRDPLSVDSWRLMACALRGW